ncbi:hypothetical protein WI560_19475 [Bradyrhizobium sp. A11]|uniref:hypothetical protein n=1 Tax=Bradyrhizobium sp. A11 TaxID=3133974 RepID=UPI003247BA54
MVLALDLPWLRGDLEKGYFVFTKLNDESLVAHYESIRKQVDLDRLLVNRGIKLVFAHGEAVKKRAGDLESELASRKIAIRPIEWCF